MAMLFDRVMTLIARKEDFTTSKQKDRMMLRLNNEYDTHMLLSVLQMMWFLSCTSDLQHMAIYTCKRMF